MKNKIKPARGQGKGFQKEKVKKGFKSLSHSSHNCSMDSLQRAKDYRKSLSKILEFWEAKGFTTKLSDYKELLIDKSFDMTLPGALKPIGVIHASSALEIITINFATNFSEIACKISDPPPDLKEHHIKQAFINMLAEYLAVPGVLIASERNGFVFYVGVGEIIKNSGGAS